MMSDAMKPHGLALLAYFEGGTDAQLMLRREDGLENFIPVSHFFRTSDEFSAIEQTAIELCRGHVLDVGAGTGLHTLALQARSLRVTAVDISNHSVDIMTQRGVRDVHCVDMVAYEGGPVDTMLMLGHGIGMVESLAGLDRFLGHAQHLIAGDGQLLVHSVDVRRTDDPTHLAYHDANRRAGRYIGTIRVQFEFQGHTGPYCDWLHVDPDALQQHAAVCGWACEIIHEEETGEYLARLTRLNAA
jgi:SAM-dependent methyltransferase